MPLNTVPLTPAELQARANAASAHLPGLILSAERLAAMVAPGAHGLRRAGPGEDFWQYRPATQGDTARAIDWRRSGRSDAQFVRDREAQTAQSVAIWVSNGQGMQFTGGADRPTKAARARLLALALAMVLLRGGEKVGLLGQPLRSGRMQAGRLAEALLTMTAGAGDDDQPDADTLRPGQRLVLIGDFLERPDWLPGVLSRASAMGARGRCCNCWTRTRRRFPIRGRWCSARSPGRSAMTAAMPGAARRLSPAAGRTARLAGGTGNGGGLAFRPSPHRSCARRRAGMAVSGAGGLMLILGPLGFIAPWVLTALIALPVLWLILRAMPPSPRLIAFPGVALLRGLVDRQPVARRTPWWLLLLRLAAVAALILAFAGPVWKPAPQDDADGPLLVVMDAGWAAAPTGPPVRPAPNAP